MLQPAKNLVKRSLEYVGLDVKRVQAPLTTLDMYTRLYGEEAVRNRRFYNFGAGAFRHEAWTNVDNPSDHYRHNFADNPQLIAHDLGSSDALRIDSASAHLAYTSHCIEHIEDGAARHFFAEVHRILRPGGIFRITVPDVDLFYRAYKNRDPDFFYWFGPLNKDREAARKELLDIPNAGASVAQMFLFSIASSVSTLHADGAPERISDQQLERMFEERGFERTLDDVCAKCPPAVQRKHPWNHINWWTKAKTVSFLKQAGFEDVQVSAFGQSLAPPLRDTKYFDSTQPGVSCYVEAVK